MSEFEKYVASAEARRTTHGEHVDKLTGYFLAEANRTREQNRQQPPAEQPEPEEPPAPPPAKRARWWQWWRR
ncbi:hypothetical protein GCM10029964_086310 [Kibdelosporangium lantanae]